MKFRLGWTAFGRLRPPCQEADVRKGSTGGRADFAASGIHGTSKRVRQRGGDDLQHGCGHLHQPSRRLPTVTLTKIPGIRRSSGRDHRDSALFARVARNL